MTWQQQFTEEFSIHFSKSELQFAVAFIEDLLKAQKKEFIENNKVFEEWIELVKDLKFNN